MPLIRGDLGLGYQYQPITMATVSNPSWLHLICILEEYGEMSYDIRFKAKVTRNASNLK